MSNLQIRKDGNTVFLSGIIDEHADFTDLFTGLASPVVIDWDGILRINSCGVREWVNALKSTSLSLIFRNCPTCVVEQFNMVPEFLGNAKVDSFYARYYSEDNDEERNVLLKVEEHFQNADDIGAPEYSDEDGYEYEFDDDEAEYFLFLENQLNED